MNRQPKTFSPARAMVALAFSGFVALAGCTNSTNSVPGTGRGTMTTYTAMENGAITPSNTPFAKGASVLDRDDDHGLTADSIVVTRTRIVISALKLGRADIDVDDSLDRDHDRDTAKDADDTVKGKRGDHEGDKDRDDGTIKVGPFVAIFDTSGEKIVSHVRIPDGVYDRIKFEIHKLSDAEEDTLINDPVFGDFVNGGRFTVIIEGIVFDSGKAYPFTFKSGLTANVMVFIDPPAVFDSTTTFDLTLKFDPKIVFGRPGAKPLDPRDPDNRHPIEVLIRSAIRALRGH